MKETTAEKYNKIWPKDQKSLPHTINFGSKVV